MKKRIASLCLALIMVMQLCGMIAFATDPGDEDIYASGTCGENLTWSLSEDYVLTISGSGDMTGVGPLSSPWNNWRTKIREVAFAEECTITAIGDNAFYSCSALEIVELPDSVVTIGKQAFANCPKLYWIELGIGVTTVGDRAFASSGGGDAYSCLVFKGHAPTFLKGTYDDAPLPFNGAKYTAYYPANDDTWTPSVMQSYGGTLTWEMSAPTSGTCGENLTWSLSDDYVLTISGTGPMTDYTYDEGEECSNAPWTAQAFDIHKVILEEGITTIGDNAFCCFWLLESVEIPASVTAIGDNAFRYSGMEIANYLNFKGNAPTFSAYACNESTLSIVYPANAEGWAALVTAPEAGEETSEFRGGWVYWLPAEDEGGAVEPEQPEEPEASENACGASLTWTLDENGLLTISGTGVMYDYHWLNNPMPWDKTAVKAVVMEEGITAIGDNAFFQCAALKSVSIPSTVTTIGIGAFYSCDVLSQVSLSESLQVIEGEAFCSCPALTEITLPSTVTELGAMAFAFSGLTRITVLTACEPTLGERVFAGQTLTTYANWASWSSDQWGTVLPVGGSIPTDTTNPVISDFWPATEDEITFCHSDTVQIAASDETALGSAEVWALIGDSDPVKIGEGNAQGGVYTINCDVSNLSGEAVLTYKVYDGAGNSAEQTANVTIRTYTRPLTPTNVTVESSFRSGTIQWEYEGDLATLKHFNIYDGDPEGGMLITSVRAYQHTFRDLEEACSYKIAAVDIYGNQSFSTESVTITPVLTETVAPVARLGAEALTAITGTAITLSGAGSNDNDKIISYAWDFGDGNTADGVHASHTYAEGGTYTVTLTVTDRSGNTDNASCTVTVLDTLGENATHAMLTVTVMDGYTAGTPGIAGVTVTVYSEGFEAVALTNTAGQASLIIPRGIHTMTVVKDGFDGRMGEITVTPDAEGGAVQTVYLAKSGVDIVGGELTVTPMDREEIEAAGIDVNAPGNNHVVKQQTTIRFQPTPEMAFDIDIEAVVNGLGELLDDLSKGFGWHTFTPDPPQPDDPEDDDDDDEEGGTTIVGPNPWPTPPKYDIGVFPVGDSAYMVIYGQSHWLKEMFNVQLIVFNNSYVDDLHDCVAELQLPEGLSLADLLEGSQTEEIYLGTLDQQGSADGTSVRQVNWYIRGDAEGDYNLTAAVRGMIGHDAPFEKTFTTKEAIHVYAGSALKLTVTLPKSAYHDKEYAVKFSLTNVSDRPIYNLTFGIDTAQQFVADRMSDNTVGEVEREYSNEDFENGMTYGLPTLEPGKAFNLVLTTTFQHENQFVEWAVGKVPGLEVGYAVADIFVTTLEGSTTEIPVEIVLEDVKKDSLFQWIWDETIGALKDNAKDTVIELIDDNVFQGVPVVEKGVEIFEVVANIKDEIEGTDAEYTPTVNVTDGVQCAPKNEVDDWLSAFDTYSLRRSAAPGVIVWTDEADAVISEDGKTMTMPSGGKLYTLRLGETAVTPEINVTTYYVDSEGTVQPFTRTLTTEETYTPGLKNAKHILLENLTETTFAIPEEGESAAVSFKGWLISDENELLLRAANEVWSVMDDEGQNAEGVLVSGGTLVIGSEANAGTYTIRLELNGTEERFEQTITLTGDEVPSEGENPGGGEVPGEGENPGGGEVPGEGENPGGGEVPGEGENLGDNEDPNPDKDDVSKPVVRPGTGSKPSISDKDKGKADAGVVEVELPFADVKEEDWFHDSVQLVYQLGLMNGTSVSEFSPTLTTNRAMVVTMLWRLAGSPKITTGAAFADVDNSWYTQAVRWAAEAGIVTGISETLFAPGASVTREQLVMILYRYAGAPSSSQNLSSFRDADQISVYALEAVRWAVETGIISGKGNGVLDPSGTATRAEVAQMFCNYINNIQ